MPSAAKASTAAPAATPSVVAGTAPKATPIPAPAAPVSAGSSSAATPTPNPNAAATAAATSAAPAAAPAPAPADPALAAQIDPIIALVDTALAANAVDASGKVSVDRATLDAIKAQLQILKQQGAKRP